VTAKSTTHSERSPRDIGGDIVGGLIEQARREDEIITRLSAAVAKGDRETAFQVASELVEWRL